MGMNWLKRHYLKSAAVLVLALASYWFGVAHPRDSFYGPPSAFRNLPITDSATCKFNRTEAVVYEGKGGILSDPLEGRISFRAPFIQEEPTILTFVDLDKETPKIKGNNGQGDLIVAFNSEDEIVLIEKDILDIGTLHTFTIFKKEGVAIWGKQYKLVVNPYGFISMGYCE